MTGTTRQRREERRGWSIEIDIVRVALKTRTKLAPLVPAEA